MCDYSLHHVGSRPAKVDDKLITTELARSSARGFAAVGELGFKLVIDAMPPKVAVCLLPGTELAFEDCVQYDRAFKILGKARTHHKLARFREIDLDDPHVHHDALEFPDGQVLKVARLVAGQTARVLQLPVAAPHAERHHATERGLRPSECRLALNRVSRKSGVAAILMPSQGTVMLWRTCRDAVASFSTGLNQSLRRLMAHRPRPILLAGATPLQIEASLAKALAGGTPRKASAAQKLEKKTKAVV